MVTDAQIEALTTEYEILHLIYHRSKNQHRQQVWFKNLAILHRKLRCILKLLYDTQLKTTIRKTTQVLEVIKYLVARKVFHRCLYEFHGIVALGQYINLGFALLGSTSKIYCLLVDFEGVREYMNVASIPVLKPLVESDDDDLGEVIEFIEEPKKVISPTLEVTSQLPVKPEKPSKPAKSKKNDMDSIFGVASVPKKKKKKKKKRSEMDDIFG